MRHELHKLWIPAVFTHKQRLLVHHRCPWFSWINQKFIRSPSQILSVKKIITTFANTEHASKIFCNYKNCYYFYRYLLREKTIATIFVQTESLRMVLNIGSVLIAFLHCSCALSRVASCLLHPHIVSYILLCSMRAMSSSHRPMLHASSA